MAGLGQVGYGVGGGHHDVTTPQGKAHWGPDPETQTSGQPPGPTAPVETQLKGQAGSLLLPPSAFLCVFPLASLSRPRSHPL